MICLCLASVSMKKLLYQMDLPCSSFVNVCSSRNYLLTGNCCSSDVSQELILLGSSNILKWVWNLIWEEGEKNWGKFIVSSVPILRERISDIVLFPCKPLTVSLHICVQKYFGIFPCRFDMGWCLNGVVTGLVEVQFFIQPLAVVLSVINSALSPGLRCPLRMSIHGVIIAARNSIRLFDVRKSRLSGILKHHAKPWLL